ncbi:MAG: family 78 glycoside hydrolase catalytic domain [Eubacteriales bacterium]|nr:family 78 glycoside hydrolase catalytic domain [Eubacteriales bacterium]
METLSLYGLSVEHQSLPMGLDEKRPRFGWKLYSSRKETVQSAYRLRIYVENTEICDTGRVASAQSIEVEAAGFSPEPMTAYTVRVTVWDNHGEWAGAETMFETGRMGVPFSGGWVEPEQEPTPDSMERKEIDLDKVTDNPFAGVERDFAEFRPAQYLRIPFTVSRPVKRARVYATAHGVYTLELNGVQADERELAPENTSYHRILQYQTYDVTPLLQDGENVIGVTLGDGWWAGRVGMSGDSCQYGDKLGLLLEGVVEYEDGNREIVTGEQARSMTGPILFSDLFVGEKYDATRELEGWSLPGYDDSEWRPVRRADYAMENLIGQYAPPVRVIRTLKPVAVLTTPAGETVLDMGQVMAGCMLFTVEAEAGVEIRLEHTEVLDEAGNFYNNILGVNKEQTVFYRTKAGRQTYRPHFTYHGFRYVRVTGWPGEILAEQFRGLVFSSEMEDTGSFETSDERLNRLQQNIWWSQIANSISVPTDCPQREKAGWTGDIMAFAPTMCFNRNADAFLTGWMRNVRADQREDGAVPMIVPYLRAYEAFVYGKLSTHTSCGWGDAVIIVPYALYCAYGDRRVLEENYGAMARWMEYIRERAENSHPQGYESWDAQRQARSRRLWNTDFHYGDWLIPSMVLGNPDGSIMMQTAYATMECVAPAYYAFSARKMAEIAEILGNKEDVAYYSQLYAEIRQAFIEEYVREDGSMEADFQGMYVIALENDLVTDEIRPGMTERLCRMIRENRGCLDTGFLSVLFLMDVLCQNGRRDVAHSLLFQTQCPSWLYEVEHGATTMWESWGAIGEDGAVSTYSYNHYAFGCIGEWLYREIGGLQAIEPGYRRIRIAPDLACGLQSASAALETPYGRAAVAWELEKEGGVLRVTVPANTTALIEIPGLTQEIGSGEYSFVIAQPPRVVYSEKTFAQ